MKIESQVCTLNQAKKLKELGILQQSYFVWGENNRKVIEEWSIEGNEDVFYAAYSVAEIGIMLKGHNTPIYWHVWNEWCFKENNDPRGYGTEASARAEYLIYLIKSNLINVDDCNNELIKS